MHVREQGGGAPSGRLLQLSPENLLSRLRQWRASFLASLGANPGAVRTLVTEELADLVEASAGTQQVGRKAMAEKMSAMMRITMNADAIEGLPGDHRDGAAGCETDVGREHAQEQMPTRRPGASLANVSNHGLADLTT